ncbi:hypothetical protein E0198_000007 [Clavispora lusitaniae]|nr:hypothetical protein E0198_000007 [Clavispora lusitaniae]
MSSKRTDMLLYGEDVFVGYRHYEMVDRKPLFPFGYGLIRPLGVQESQRAEVSRKDYHMTHWVTGTCSSKRDGSEVVQIYVSHENPRIIRPAKELKDFAKVFLKSGETKSVSVEMPLLEVTSYWDSYKNQWLSEKATYHALVGASSDNIVGDAVFSTEKDVYWLGV